MMRIASVLLVAVLLSTCTISGTFAKYVTEGTGTDSARVAKFGVEVIANGSTFAKEYDTDDKTFTEAKSVISTDKVVAPGTDGEMVNMALAGTPEVAVRVSYTGAFDISGNWTVDGKFYCPLVIKVNDDTVYGSACKTEVEFENAVNALINAYSKDYPAGTILAGLGEDALDITWQWPFVTYIDGNICDYNDTWLGNQAAAGNPATVTLTVTTTVTQID